MRFARFFGLVLLAASLLTAEAAHARPGLGGSFGSRGSRTYMPPARTATTPYGAQPFSTPRPAFAARPAPAFGGGFGLHRGRFAGGFMGGLIGAGIFGLLIGHGMFGGLNGMGGMLGLLTQLGLLFLLVRWLMRMWSGGSAARPAMAGGVQFGAPQPQPGAAAGGQRGPNVPLAQNDYAAFEGILQEVQRAWTRGDVAALGRVTTPEMAANFGRQMAELGGRGLRNATSAVRFDGGDLAESWREGTHLFATVAMRYSMIDVTTDGSGRVVDGNATERVEAREYWTFVRQAVGSWRLSAIQQA